MKIPAPTAAVRRSLRYLLLATSITFIAACSSDDEDDTTPPPQGEVAITYSASGNTRALPLTYSVNGERYTQYIEAGEHQLEQRVSAGDEVAFSFDNIEGHTCSATPENLVVSDSTPSVSIECEAFGSVSVVASNYRTAFPISDVEIEVYTFNESDGASIHDSDAYSLLDTVQTDPQGRASIAGVGYQQRIVLRSNRDGFVSRSDVVRVSEENAATSVSIAMLQVDAQVTFDAASATTVEVEGTPLAVSLPANAFVDAEGNTVSGEVTAKLTNIDASSDPDIMPGDYEAYDPVQGVIQQIESFGAMDASFSDSAGQSINLADGAEATVRIPLARRATNPPTTIPLIHFNEVTGIWDVEGEASLQTDGDTDTQFYEGVVSHFSTWNADVLFDSVQINGCVLGENSDTPLSGVRIRAEGVDYIGRSTAYSDLDGNYSVAVRPNSSVLVSVDDTSGISTTFPLDVGSEDLSLNECLSATPGAMRVILTWGENPRDLDTHFMGPTVANGEAANERFRVYFSNREENINGETIYLDVDDTSSFGPEITTVSAFPHPGVYRYAVHHFGGTGTIYQSPTRVELQINGESHIFAPSEDHDTTFIPSTDPDFRGALNTWVAFDLVVDEDGEVTIVPVDEYLPRNHSDIEVDGEASQANSLFPAKASNPTQ